MPPLCGSVLLAYGKPAKISHTESVNNVRIAFTCKQYFTFTFTLRLCLISTATVRADSQSRRINEVQCSKKTQGNLYVPLIGATAATANKQT